MISVIMPVYNREKTIDRALESVFNQTFQDWELLVVDDGSNDQTADVVKKWVTKDKRVIFLKNGRKKGVSGARNTGIFSAKGEYIAFLDSDDVWYNYHLEECLKALEFSKYNFCSALWRVDAYGEKVNIGESGWFDYIFNEMKESLDVDRKDKYWVFDDRLFEHVVKTNFYCFHINTIVVKKQVLLDLGGFDETFTSSEDLDLVYRVLQRENLVTVNNFHFIYYYGVDNIYAFYVRGSEKFQKLIEDKGTVKRITRNTRNKIKLHKKTRKWVIESKTIKEKKILLDKLDHMIYDRIMSCAWLNQRVNPIVCLYMFIASMKYWKKCRKKEEGKFFIKGEYRKNKLFLD